MNKILSHTLAVIFALALIVSITPSTYAVELGTDELEDIIPPEYKDYFTDDPETSVGILDGVDISFFMSFSAVELGNSLAEALKLILYLFGMILLSSFADKLIDRSGAMGDSLKFVFTLFSGLFVYTYIRELFDVSCRLFSSVGSFMGGFGPVFFSFYTLSGELGLSSVGALFNMLIISCAELLSNGIVVPLFGMCSSLEIVSLISSKSEISAISGFIKKSFVWFSGIVMSIVTALFTYQTVIAKNTDTASLKAMRLLSGNIPVVGGAVSEASSTILGSFGIIKGVGGGVGVAVVLLMLLPPLIRLFVIKTAFALGSEISSGLECSYLKKLFSSASSLVGFILSISAMFSVMIIYFFTLLITLSVI